MGKKAEDTDLIGRWREIVSDPLNFTIKRDPRAGFIENNYVYLHNGLKVPFSGPNAYYGDFSTILAVNRGVHEPLEEFVFQEVLKHLPESPVMLELGAYWGHYSMWLHLARPNADTHLVEPELQNLNAGKTNFAHQGFTGRFVNAFVGKGHFEVDKYLEYLGEQGIEKLDILHSDIQGFEIEMLQDAPKTLSEKRADYIFLSTHLQAIHTDAIRILESHGYRIEVSSDFDNHTTSYDGFILATSPNIDPVFTDFKPLSRLQIEEAGLSLVNDYLSKIANWQNR